MDLSEYVNVHAIEARASLRDVSDFYRAEFDRCAVEDIEALIQGAKEMAEDAAEDDAEEVDEQVSKLEEVAERLNGFLQETEARVAELEAEARSSKTLGAAGARLRISALEGELAAAKARIAELSAITPATIPPKKRAKRRVDDQTMRIDFAALSAANDTTAPKKPRSRKGQPKGDE